MQDITDLAKKNVQCEIPFRVLMGINVCHDVGNSLKKWSDGKYSESGTSLLMALCSGITGLYYPTNHNWSKNYTNKIPDPLIAIISGIAMISCADAVKNSMFNPVINIPSDTLLSIGITAKPFFSSSVYFGLNINK